MGRITQFNQRQLAQVVNPTTPNTAGFGTARTTANNVGIYGALTSSIANNYGRQSEFAAGQVARGLGQGINYISNSARLRQMAQARREEQAAKINADVRAGAFKNQFMAGIGDVIDIATKEPESEDAASQNFNQGGMALAHQLITGMGMNPLSDEGKVLTTNALNIMAGHQLSVANKAKSYFDNKNAANEVKALDKSVKAFGNYSTSTAFDEGMKQIQGFVGDTAPLSRITPPKDFVKLQREKPMEAANAYLQGFLDRGDPEGGLKELDGGRIDPYLKPGAKADYRKEFEQAQINNAKGMDAQSQISAMTVFKTIDEEIIKNPGMSGREYQALYQKGYESLVGLGAATPDNVHKLATRRQQYQGLYDTEKKQAVSTELSRIKAGETGVPLPPADGGQTIGPGQVSGGYVTTPDGQRVPTTISGKKGSTASGLVPAPPAVPPSGAVFGPIQELSAVPGELGQPQQVSQAKPHPLPQKAEVSNEDVVKRKQLTGRLSQIDQESSQVAALLRDSKTPIANHKELLDRLGQLKAEKLGVKDSLETLDAKYKDKDAQLVKELYAKYDTNYKAAVNKYLEDNSPEAEARVRDMKSAVRTFMNSLKADATRGMSDVKIDENLKRMEALMGVFAKNRQVEATVNVDGFGSVKASVPGFGKQHQAVDSFLSAAIDEGVHLLTTALHKTYNRDKRVGIGIPTPFGTAKIVDINASDLGEKLSNFARSGAADTLLHTLGEHKMVKDIAKAVAPSEEALLITALRGEVNKQVDAESKRLNRDLSPGEIDGTITEVLMRKLFIDRTLGLNELRSPGQLYSNDKGAASAIGVARKARGLK